MELTNFLEELMPSFNNYQESSHRLFAKCMPVKNVREGIDVYKVVGDIAIVACLFVEFDENHQFVSARLSRQVVEDLWHEDPDAIVKEAIVHTPIIDKPVLVGVDYCSMGITHYGLDDPEAESIARGSLYAVLSTEHHALGSTMAFIPEILGRFCRWYGTDSLYLAFTSQYEVMVHPVLPVGDDASLTPEKLREVITGMDDSCGPIALSHEVYRYTQYTRGGEVTVAR